MKVKVAMLVLMFQSCLLGFSQSKVIEYNDGNQVLSGISVKPSKALANKAGVLILPAWMGIDDHAKDTANRLAAMGYTTFVADIYGADKRPKNYSEAGEKAGYFKKNIREYQTRIKLALDQLVKQGVNPDKIVVLGYCFGGTGAIEAARTNMKVNGVVSFHGGLGRDVNRDIVKIIPKVLVLHGADDPYESKEEISAFQEEMRRAEADWQMVYYAKAVHSFTDKSAGTDNSKGAAYNELADKRSWQAMLAFLKEVL
ncbi:dienelactone hydrolase family protein [Flavobacterium silvisoli]|uniref:Dienelactone hydrolase family protein n=1 Tax=Flavobacterium silvisoli TaxID=2529433 RepID=A0A4Q9YTU9_9FLAO|nr:dienelactone hydrolase family protein [Flavobacterium silvisoli]TBX67044.1 dienelactone hydrolase family protein [Flavobacterium silvisoli]